MTEYLFLYGTLKPNKAAGDIAETVQRLRPLGPATVPGRLYDFGDYPGAVIDQSARTSIKGELCELPSDGSTLKSLDEYEEFNTADRKNSLFVRARAIADLNDGRRLTVWVYVYNRDPGGARLIVSGDYSESKAA